MPSIKPVFDNAVQATLYRRFIIPALVNGPWRNTYPSDHHEPWVNAQISIRESAGRHFKVSKSGYNLFRLLPSLALQMRAVAYYAKMEGEQAGMAVNVNPENIIEEALDDAYSLQELKTELRAIKRAMTTDLTPADAAPAEAEAEAPAEAPAEAEAEAPAEAPAEDAPAEAVPDAEESTQNGDVQHLPDEDPERGSTTPGTAREDYPPGQTRPSRESLAD